MMHAYLCSPHTSSREPRRWICSILKRYGFEAYDPLEHGRVAVRIDKEACERNRGILKIDGVSISMRNLVPRPNLCAYLCGPMTGYPDSSYRDEMKRILEKHGYTYYDPQYMEQTIRSPSPCVRTRARRIIKRDETAIKKSDMLIGYFPVASDGSAMELLYTNFANVLTIAVLPETRKNVDLHLLKSDVILVGFRALDRLFADRRWLQRYGGRRIVNLDPREYDRAIRVIKRNEEMIRKSDLVVGYFPSPSIGASAELAYAHHIFIPTIAVIPHERKEISPFLFKADKTLWGIEQLENFLRNRKKIRALIDKYAATTA